MGLKETCQSKFWPRKKWGKNVEKNPELATQYSVKYLYKALLKKNHRAKVVLRSDEGLVIRVLKLPSRPIHILLEPK